MPTTTEAEIVPPPGLVELKARWYAAREQVERIRQETPEGVHLPGAVEKWLFSEDQSARLGAAREIYRDPWKRNPPGNRGAAEKALNTAAKALLESERAATAL